MDALVSGDPIMLMMLDIDRRTNQRHLRSPHRRHRSYRTRQEADKLARRGDVVARYGGEEFLILIQGSAPSLAALIAERFREGIENMPVPEIHGGLTTSIGVACWDGQGTPPTAERLIQVADEALYLAKEQGRNRVATATVTNQDEKNDVD